MEDLTSIQLADVGGAMALCRHDGQILDASPTCRALLSRTGGEGGLPLTLPTTLWRLLSERPVGEAVQWRAPSDLDFLLGCTRYRLGDEDFLPIVFNSDVLSRRFDELDRDAAHQTLADVQTAATRLRTTIDALLDYVRIGPPVSSEVSLKEVMNRVTSLLRPLCRSGSHRLISMISDDADRVRGNAFAIEHIFLNLIVNAVEAARRPATVKVTTERMRRDGRSILRALVEDDGPGLTAAQRLAVFDPTFPMGTTKEDGTGIGLSSAREAARGAGGDLELLRWTDGVTFAVVLPLVNQPQAQGS